MAIVASPPAAPTPTLVQRITTFGQGVMVELRKVTWPDVPQVRQATIAIIIFVLILGMMIGVLDVILRWILVKMIPSLFAGG